MPARKRKVTRSKKQVSLEDQEDIEELEDGAKFEDSILGAIKKYFHVHLDNYESSHGRRIEGTLFALNFLAIFLFILDTHSLVGFGRTLVRSLELFLVSIFVVEYIARFWIAKRKLHHFFSVYSLIDLISILPILANFANLTFFRIFRILRLFRILRILRFQRIFKQKDTLFGRLTDTQLIVTRIILTVFTIIFVFSGLIWAVESNANPDYGNIWNAMYFSVVTLSTVGYGDITPLSPLGRIITVAMIFSGIAIIPWQLGKLVKVVIGSTTKTTITCKKCKFPEHEKDANFCKNCGTVLPHRKKRVMVEESMD